MPTEAEIDAGTAAVRNAINASGYGSWVSDAQCQELASAVLEAAEMARGEPADPESL